MTDYYRKTKIRREDSLLEEALDREGDWVREFSSRSIIWPVFEHWAAENGYRLIALRNKRRLYQFGRDNSQFITFLDIRQDGNHVRLKAWTQVRVLARSLRLFLIPAKMTIDPQGWLAIRYRRKVCHHLNSLLERLAQPPILHSKTFHWADLDVTTLALIALVIAPTSAFTYVSMPKITSVYFQFDPETLAIVASTLGIRLAVLFLLGLLVLGVHHWIIVERVRKLWARLLSVLVASSLMASLSMGIRPHDDPAQLRKQAALHCFHVFDSERCEDSLGRLSSEDRMEMKRELKLFYKELSRIERAHPPGSNIR